MAAKQNSFILGSGGWPGKIVCSFLSLSVMQHEIYLDNRTIFLGSFLAKQH